MSALPAGPVPAPATPAQPALLKPPAKPPLEAEMRAPAETVPEKLTVMLTPPAWAAGPVEPRMRPPELTKKSLTRNWLVVFKSSVPKFATVRAVP